jgi:hypothetical protein
MGKGLDQVSELVRLVRHHPDSLGATAPHGPPELKGLPMELLLNGFGLRSPTSEQWMQPAGSENRESDDVRTLELNLTVS